MNVRSEIPQPLWSRGADPVMTGIAVTDVIHYF